MTEHDDSFPSLMPKPGAPLLPVQMGRRAGDDTLPGWSP